MVGIERLVVMRCENGHNAEVQYEHMTSCLTSLGSDSQGKSHFIVKTVDKLPRYSSMTFYNAGDIPFMVLFSDES